MERLAANFGIFIRFRLEGCQDVSALGRHSNPRGLAMAQKSRLQSAGKDNGGGRSAKDYRMTRVSFARIGSASDQSSSACALHFNWSAGVPSLLGLRASGVPESLARSEEHTSELQSLR